MHARMQIASILFAVAVLVLVFELVRRRKLSERYALLWMSAALALLLLAAWQRLLYLVSRAVGIYYPPTTFLVIAFGFALMLLLNFSIASSRLSAETRTLAQRVALLEMELAHADPDAPLERDRARDAELHPLAGARSPRTGAQRPAANPPGA